MRATCAGCLRRFEAKTSRARFCSDACRARAHRGKGRQTGPPPKPAPHVNLELIAAVRRELEEAGQVETVEGQIALALAERVATEGTPNLVASSTALRAALTRALANVAGPEDEVTAARRSRAEKRRKLGLEDR